MLSWFKRKWNVERDNNIHAVYLYFVPLRLRWYLRFVVVNGGAGCLAIRDGNQGQECHRIEWRWTNGLLLRFVICTDRGFSIILAHFFDKRKTHRAVAGHGTVRYHLFEIWPDQTGSNFILKEHLLYAGFSSKVAPFSSMLGDNRVWDVSTHTHTGILLFQPTFLAAPWFGWIVHCCQLCDPLRNTVYRSVVVASGFGMFNRSFHWVLQMNLIWIEGKEEKLQPC